MLKESTSKLDEELKACKRERQKMLVKQKSEQRKNTKTTSSRRRKGRVSPSQQQEGSSCDEQLRFEDADEMKQLLRDRRPSHVDAEGRECKHLGFWRRDQLATRARSSDKKLVSRTYHLACSVVRAVLTLQFGLCRSGT